MSKQNQAVETQQKKQNQQKSGPEIAGEQTIDQINSIELLRGVMGVGGDPSTQAQAMNITDRRFFKVQRQAMVTQIGRVSGNKHLQRVMAHAEEPGPDGSVLNSLNQDKPVQRQEIESPPPNSYSQGKGLQWAGGGVVEAEHNEQFVKRQTAALEAVASLIGKIAGLNLTSIMAVKNMKAQVEGEKEIRRQEIDFLESEIEYEWENHKVSRFVEQVRMIEKLKRTKAELAAIEGGDSDILAQTISIGSAVVEYGGKVNAIGASLHNFITGATFTDFQDVGDALGVFSQCFDVAKVAHKFLDMSEINNFRANPCFETAEAWGLKVGSVFDEASGLASGLPMGWGEVISGAMQMPNVVINQFIGLVKARYEKLDALLQTGGSELIMVKEGKEAKP
jgi:hypothetical protein